MVLYLIGLLIIGEPKWDAINPIVKTNERNKIVLIFDSPPDKLFT
jgi:hypothetical protein